MRTRIFIAAVATAATLAANTAHAEMTAEELAKIAQNPVGNLISLPFQNNTNLNFGPERTTGALSPVQRKVLALDDLENDHLSSETTRMSGFLKA